MKKLLFILSVFALSLSVSVETKAQVKVMLNPSSVATESVVNAATAFLTAQSNGTKNSTTVQVNVTKVSGTVGGTLSLLGSIDGVNFKALTLVEAATALTTYTATDVATQTFIWRLNGSPVNYYRVSYTGVTGPMSATFTAFVLGH